MEEMISILQFAIFLIVGLMFGAVTLFIVVMGKTTNKENYSQNQSSKDDWQTNYENYLNKNDDDDGPIQNL